jgi:uncharacterized protein YegP (UPF0339 family)
VYKDASDKYYFRLKARNGQVVATSGSYTAKKSCLNGIASVRNNVNSGVVVEE